MKKIGILGGTFNPIHIGHLILAQNALEECKLEKVMIMPTGVSYLKDTNTVLDKTHRIAMVSKAIEDNSSFELSTIETQREGYTYTSETLEILCDANPDVEYHFIIGADTLFDIEKWHDPQGIFDRATIICARRNGTSIKKINQTIENYKEKFNARIILLDSKELEISSTDIRKKIKDGLEYKYYLTEKVCDYIKSNSLYI